VFNLFGLLPYAVPEFLHIGVWPIIMGITMWVQMQLNPQQPDPLQQKIFNWMPVMFTFLLASFSVGLVIYWAWNNVLSLLQQYTIMRKNGAEIHLWKNMGIEKVLARVRSGERMDVGGAMSRGSASLRRGAESLSERVGSRKKSTSRETQDKSTASESGGGATAASSDMTREQAFKTLGLEPGATATEVDAAFKKHTGENASLNGSGKLSQARDVLRGSEGS